MPGPLLDLVVAAALDLVTWMQVEVMDRRLDLVPQVAELQGPVDPRVCSSYLAGAELAVEALHYSLGLGAAYLVVGDWLDSAGLLVYLVLDPRIQAAVSVAD